MNYLEVINIASKFDAKGFKQAETALGKLSGTAKKLAGGLGLAFGARAVAMYGKNAVNAFAADDKAAKTLAKTLDNLGSGFANPAVADFIAKLEKTTGVLDDQLRPAYQKLFTTTGDWRKSQDLLKNALDLSAQSGIDVVSVSDDLARAYAGNTKGLQKYGLGFTKTELAAADFDTILQRIADVSTGQAQVAADSLSGSIDKLQVASANAAETIGKGLSQAFTELSGQNGIGATTDAIGFFASGISDAIIGTERLIKLVGIFATGGGLKGMTDFIKEYKKADMLSRQQYGGIYAQKYIAEAQASADKLAKKRALELLAIKNKQLAAERAALKAKQLQAAIDKANAALGKGEEIFNLAAIQLNAALINQTEQLGKATTSSQVLAIANDMARLKVKQDILTLEAAIASGDEASITAATAKLNADMKILSTLQGQNAKLLDIKSVLDSLIPKDLINLNNLNEALRLLSQINLLSTGSKTTPAGYSTGTGAAANQYPNNTGYPNYGIQQAASIAATNLNTELLGGVVSVIGDNLKEYLAPSAGMISGISPSGREYNFTINVGAVASPEEFTGLIQDTIIRLNKQGDYLTTAGAL